MELMIAIAVILVASIVIYYIGSFFARASSNLGDYLKMPRSVKGATFDAIASSLPELLVALYAVIFFNKFEVGIGTIAGSALFNLLVIPGICVLVSPVVFKVSKKVITRDALFYILSVFVLLVLLLYFKTWGLVIAIILIAFYFLYLFEIVSHISKYRKKKNYEKPEGMKLSKEILIALGCVVVIGIATFFLTKSSIDLSTVLGVSPIIIAFSVTAAATSVPDMVISIVNAKKGDVTDATSNVFGSNIFDIFMGLGIPLLIYSIFVGSVEIVFDNLEIIIGLLGSTILVLYFFADNHTLTKKQGILLLLIYAAFLAYVVLLSFKWF